MIERNSKLSSQFFVDISFSIEKLVIISIIDGAVSQEIKEDIRASKNRSGTKEAFAENKWIFRLKELYRKNSFLVVKPQGTHLAI